MSRVKADYSPVYKKLLKPRRIHELRNNSMALLRNREVTVLGPNGTVTSPIFTVLYPDGNREDTELRYIHMTEAEKTEFEKKNPSFVGQVRTVDDKRLQKVRDDQDRTKIEKAREKQPDANQPVVAKTYVKPAEVKAS